MSTDNLARSFMYPLTVTPAILIGFLQIFVVKSGCKQVTEDPVSINAKHCLLSKCTILFKILDHKVQASFVSVHSSIPTKISSFSIFSLSSVSACAILVNPSSMAIGRVEHSSSVPGVTHFPGMWVGGFYLL